tara:strand:+ start:719 stop:853 length:135 start_codon:yes stop_codon:yes gene_type:complete
MANYLLVKVGNKFTQKGIKPDVMRQPPDVTGHLPNPANLAKAQL